MKKLMHIAFMMALVVVAFSMTGCQTRITATKNPEQVFLIQEKVTVGGEEKLVTKEDVRASGGWEATARSPLYATEALEGLDIGVHTNGSVTLSINKYSRDLSTNSVVMVKEMFSGGAQLVTAIGDAYVKIAGGGAQASTALNVANKVYTAFTDAGGDVSKATVTTDDETKILKVSDGTTCVECAPDGTCNTCSDTK